MSKTTKTAENWYRLEPAATAEAVVAESRAVLDVLDAPNAADRRALASIASSLSHEWALWASYECCDDPDEHEDKRRRSLISLTGQPHDAPGYTPLRVRRRDVDAPMSTADLRLGAAAGALSACLLDAAEGKADRATLTQRVEAFARAAGVGQPPARGSLEAQGIAAATTVPAKVEGFVSAETLCNLLNIPAGNRSAARRHLDRLRNKKKLPMCGWRDAGRRENNGVQYTYDPRLVGPFLNDFRG